MEGEWLDCDEQLVDSLIIEWKSGEGEGMMVGCDGGIGSNRIDCERNLE